MSPSYTASQNSLHSLPVHFTGTAPQLRTHTHAPGSAEDVGEECSTVTELLRQVELVLELPV
jgi:hypothetical protein